MDESMRIAVFVDGAHLRYRLRDAGIDQYKWKADDWMKFFNMIAGQSESTHIHYYNAEFSKSHSRYEKQKNFLEQIDEMEDVSVKLGVLRIMEDNSLVEKQVDTKITLDMVLLSDSYDRAILISGDEDFVPAIDVLHERGKEVIVTSGRDHTSDYLIEAADGYMALDELLTE